MPNWPSCCPRPSAPTNSASSTRSSYRQALHAAGALPGIGADLRTAIETNYPVVRSVAFATPLDTLPPALDDVGVHGTEWRLRARIDLDDLPGTAVRIAERFAALLRDV